MFIQLRRTRNPARELLSGRDAVLMDMDEWRGGTQAAAFGDRDKSPDRSLHGKRNLDFDSYYPSWHLYVREEILYIFTDLLQALRDSLMTLDTG